MEIFPGILVGCFTSLLPLIVLKLLVMIRRYYQSASTGLTSVAFFHPYCNAGGGGERVLWCAVRAVQKEYPKSKCLVYTGDTDATPEAMLALARQRFSVSVDPSSIEFVFLRLRWLVEASTYPHFTLIGQSLGGAVLGLEALWRRVPDVYIDSMGYSFTLPIFRWLGGCRTGCYVHYPTISTDMLAKVGARMQSFNNRGWIASYRILTHLKVAYYWMFAFVYGLAGKASECIAVNSSWTQGHIVYIWGRPHLTRIVYPPCDVTQFVALKSTSESLLREKNEMKILSVGQFRPEKDHLLQLHSFRKFCDLLQSEEDTFKKVTPRLVLIGGCRGAADEERVASLQREAENLEISDQIDWLINADFAKLKLEMASALVGVHTMWNEHFGIAVVEGMAAGQVMVAHNSGGPKMDIIISSASGQITGLLADTSDSYANAFLQVLRMSPEERDDIRSAARASMVRFTEEWFEEEFLECFRPLLA